MERIERVQRVVRGQAVDRAPVSFWYHFTPDQVCGPAAVKAHLSHAETFDLDFLKVMNDNGYPHDGLLGAVEDLASLELLRGDEPTFARQLELIAELKRKLDGRMLMTTTVFNAWATLRRLVRGPAKKHRPPNLDAAADQGTAILMDFLERDYAAVKQAIRVVGTSLRNFAKRCLEAGADGIFVSVRDDWLDGGGYGGQRYDELVRESDLEILSGASEGELNTLHVCGKAVDFQAFADYPVHVLNWADRAAGPSIREVSGVLKPAICAGVDNLSTLPNGTAADCEREVADALSQSGERPMMIAPGCTFNPDVVPQTNLEAMCRAARE
ncbi:MAG: hypothetical protein MI923_05405 [Phycisphaerales bacterium]|nr:hypothetical protein [Phycisphaerales bacterium]